ncbi:MAG: hypothetical protein LBK06_09305 [Planctomycetaceae bacterium]|nr:hypothetical protein [Planctomycetaceae bacterium]
MSHYAKSVLKFAKLNTVAQQREAVTRGRSLLTVYNIFLSLRVVDFRGYVLFYCVCYTGQPF